MRVALYARVSSEAQDVELSIAAQLRALRDYAKSKGDEIICEYTDEAETGRTDARPAFREMIHFARRKPKEIDAILVWKYSRFARNREDSIVYKTLLRKNGIQVISINEIFDDSPSGRLSVAIIEDIDEYYSDNLGEEVTRGMRESVSRGFYISVNPPYGYSKVKVADGNKTRSKLKIKPDEANIVKKMFDAIISGKGITEIVKELNNTGIPSPKNKRWGKTSIYSILSNEVYTGTVVWGRNSKRNLEPIRVTNSCEPIIDKQIFDTVKQILKQRAPQVTHPRITSSHFLLSGLTRCAYCGRPMTGCNAKSGHFSYYVCQSLRRHGAQTCKAKYIPAPKLEKQILEKISGNILTEDNLRELLELSNQEMDKAFESVKCEQNILDDKITDIDYRLSNIYKAIESGNFDLPDLSPRLKELHKQKALLSTKQTELKTTISEYKVSNMSPEQIAFYIKDLKELLDEAELGELKAFIRNFVKEIRIRDNEVTLEYFAPIAEMNTNKRVLPIVQNGGR
ncbi:MULTISPECIES: recombinase family protein [Dehalococcoides]|uniref:recombinase family protein n=1 Tax=Dehalococcoides TaxID=61434 RepID=UPI000804D1F3|nr:recombinase family protein [Dehalococcoides mccartyi]OBW61628.1 MAG: serine recombinase [Dehalococcoides mccartyi]